MVRLLALVVLGLFLASCAHCYPRISRHKVAMQCQF